MALTLSNTNEDLPIDLSSHRSPSPQITISMGHNHLLEQTMAAAALHRPLQQDAEDLRVTTLPPTGRRPLKLHIPAPGDVAKARDKKRRLEETVDMLKVQQKDEELSSIDGEDMTGHDTDGGSGATPQLLQHLLLLQQKEYSPLLYLQYCALLQSLQLSQALRQQSSSSCSTPPSPQQLPFSELSEDHSHQQQPLELHDHEDHSPSSSPSTASSSTSGVCIPLGHNGSRRRAPRTLTGKHVKQGQGASPDTLRTLKSLVLERTRLRALGLLPAPTVRAKRTSKKVNKRVK